VHLLERLQETLRKFVASSRTDLSPQSTEKLEQLANFEIGALGHQFGATRGKLLGQDPQSHGRNKTRKAATNAQAKSFQITGIEVLAFAQQVNLLAIDHPVKVSGSQVATNGE